MNTLRDVSKEEWLAHYRNKGDRPEDYIHVEADGTERPWTEEEWEDMILEHRRHPDLDGKDLSYIGKRREEYPDETEQLGVIWSILAKLSEDGVDIGDQGREWVKLFKDIKAKYPKPD
jgi:hypothetical protein